MAIIRDLMRRSPAGGCRVLSCEDIVPPEQGHRAAVPSERGRTHQPLCVPLGHHRVNRGDGSRFIRTAWMSRSARSMRTFPMLAALSRPRHTQRSGQATGFYSWSRGWTGPLAIRSTRVVEGQAMVRLVEGAPSRCSRSSGGIRPAGGSPLLLHQQHRQHVPGHGLGPGDRTGPRAPGRQLDDPPIRPAVPVLPRHPDPVPAGERGQAELAVGMQTLIMVTAFCCAIFLLLPAEIDMRDQIDWDSLNGWEYALFEFIHLSDNPWNAWPSLHIVHSYLLARLMTVWASRRAAESSAWNLFLGRALGRMGPAQHQHPDHQAALPVRPGDGDSSRTVCLDGN